MVLPMMAWMGAWNRPTLHLLSTTRIMIEKTLRTYVGERSTALGAILRVGWKLDPEYQMDWAAFRYLLKSFNNERTPCTTHPRMREVLTKYKWKVRDDGILQFRNSVFDSNWDGEVALQQTLIPIWEAHPFTRDERGLKKAETVEDIGDMKNRCLNITEQRKVAANFTHNDMVRAALLATPVGQRISNMFPDKQYKCWCGERLPQRGHLLWDCPSLAVERREANIKPPRDLLEKELLVENMPNGYPKMQKKGGTDQSKSLAPRGNTAATRRKRHQAMGRHRRRIRGESLSPETSFLVCCCRERTSKGYSNIG